MGAETHVNAGLKEIKGDKLPKEEADALDAWLKLGNQGTNLISKCVKDAKAVLDDKAYGISEAD